MTLADEISATTIENFTLINYVNKSFPQYGFECCWSSDIGGKEF
jgi:hypothetical protein